MESIHAMTMKLYECNEELLRRRRKYAEKLRNLWEDWRVMEIPPQYVKPDVLKLRSRLEAEVKAHVKAVEWSEATKEELRRVYGPIEKAAFRLYLMLDGAEPLAFLEDNEGPCYCPNFYNEIISERYPDPVLLNEIQTGKLRIGDPMQGVLLTGPTGAGKTFAGWQILRNWLKSHGDLFIYSDYELVNPPAVFFTAPGLKELATAAAMRDKEAREKWRELIDGKSLVFIDDLHQVKFSSAFAERLFELIENVVANRRPFIATVQMTGKALMDKWTADDPKTVDTARAILRRLVKDHCAVVRVTPEKSK